MGTVLWWTVPDLRSGSVVKEVGWGVVTWALSVTFWEAEREESSFTRLADGAICEEEAKGEETMTEK